MRFARCFESKEIWKHRRHKSLGGVHLFELVLTTARVKVVVASFMQPTAE